MDTPRYIPPDPYPAIHSLIEGASLGHLVRHDFGLRASGPIRLIQSGLNDHYALPTQQRDFVIRVYRHGWRSNDDVLAEAQGVSRQPSLLYHLVLSYQTSHSCRLMYLLGRLYPDGYRSIGS
jgi:hypothetical protein